MNPVKVGIIGCGNIFDAYLNASKNFPILDIACCADLRTERAQTKAEQWGLQTQSIDSLLQDDSVEIILNLTTPESHIAVARQVLTSGKHVYTEKPLGLNVEEGIALLELASSKNLRVGSAPDTFLGGSHQKSRQLLDAGTIGDPLACSAFMMVPGHELWHPDPDFYYLPGGGPMLDMGPYYLTAFINLLGPVSRVTGTGKAFRKTRMIATGPRANQNVAVKTPTHLTGVAEFTNGALLTITMSFDVWKHEHKPMELYGTKGSMLIPDPNCFDGEVHWNQQKEDWEVAKNEFPYADDNYRSLGLADMAQAIRTGRPHRANGQMGLHVLEIMTGFLKSAESGSTVDMITSCERPEAMKTGLPFGHLD
ncbi:MAG: Gfo/Idh/MocA family oxidoreductase [Deltaproteobacteria bacterium]